MDQIEYIDSQEIPFRDQSNFKFIMQFLKY